MYKNIDQIIARILSSEASVQDILLFTDWLNQDVKNKKEFEQLRSYWESSEEEQQIAMPEIAFEKIKDRLVSPNTPGGRFPHRKKIRSLAATIAVLVVAAFTTYLWQKDHRVLENNIYVCPNGSYKLTLSDGTIAYLNKNSKLTYSNQYDNGIRNVRLEGEAYFDVAKSANAFTVSMGQYSIDVLGTKFNVQAFQCKPQIIVTLEEGAITFKDGKQQITVAPDQQLMYQKDNAEFDLRQVNTELFTSWKGDIYKYRGITMLELCRELEQMYGVEIRLHAKMENVKVSGSFDYQQSVEQILNIMQKSMSFDWTRKGDQITID